MNLVTNLKKTVVAVALGALAFAGVASATVSSALADTPAATVPPQHINTAAKGTINIHKFANPASGTAGNGNTVTPTTAPVNGVVFTYQKVKDVDLTSNEGWKAAANLKVKVDGDSVTVVNKDAEGTVHTLAEAADFPATSGKGLATQADLPLGVYLIKEKSAPNSVVAKAAPFLVTVPFPNEDANTKATTPWLYEVNVYPKNTVLTDEERPHKALDDQDKGVHFPGDKISWTITQTIPKLADGETLKNYVFEDTLPATVKPIADGEKADKVLVEVKQGDTVADPAPTATIAVDGQKVTVSFASAELAKLKAGQVVKIQLITELKSDAEIKALGDEAQKSVSNQSVTTINDQKYHSVPPGYDYGTNGDPDDPKYDVPGQNRPGVTPVDLNELQIHKKNAENQPLQGAEFQVAPKPENATCDEAAFTANTYKDKLVTDADGNASLKVVAGEYCVKETKAPLGYVINPNSGIHADPITVTKAAAGTVTIENQKVPTSSLPSLPVTGASGFIILLLGGSAVIALAVGTGFVATSRRKRNS